MQGRPHNCGTVADSSQAGANQSFLGEIDVWIRIDDSPIFGSRWSKVSVAMLHTQLIPADSMLDLRQRWSFRESFEVGFFLGKKGSYWLLLWFLLLLLLLLLLWCFVYASRFYVNFKHVGLLGLDLLFDLGRWVLYFLLLFLSKKNRLTRWRWVPSHIFHVVQY